MRRSTCALFFYSLTDNDFQDSSKNHRIDEDGYNIGRDFFVEKAIAGSHWEGKWWQADVEWRTGLMRRGKRGACISSKHPE